MNFPEQTAAFLTHCGSAISLSKHTLRAYASDLKDAGAFFMRKGRQDAIAKDDIRQYIRHMREERALKESTIKRRLASLKLLFRWLCEEEAITSNPFTGLNERIRLPRQLPRTLDRSHTALLHRAVSRPSGAHDFDAFSRRTAIQLLLETGIRVGELSNILVDDLSLADHVLRIRGKGNRQRIVYILAAPLRHALQRYLEQRQKVQATGARLFITANGHSLTPPRLRQSLREIATTAGIQRRVTPHMLRHTRATRWLEAGLDIRHVQKLLGHHSISTTEIYTHVSDQGLLEALRRAGVGDN